MPSPGRSRASRGHSDALAFDEQPTWDEQLGWAEGLGREAGAIGDFQFYLSENPQFSAAWSDIQKQIISEGGDITRIDGARQAFTDSFSQLASSAIGAVGDPIGTAKQYVMLGQTVLGAAQTVGSLVDAAMHSPPEAVMRAFTGTMIGIGVAAGSVTAGLGAAIVGGVGLILDVMGKAGLWAQPQYSCIFLIGGLCVSTDTRNPRVQPGSINWRTFPDPAKTASCLGGAPYAGESCANDAAWYESQTPGRMICYGGGTGNYGVGWRGLYLQSCHPGERPIDTAFPNFRQVESLARGGNFERAFAGAWKANAEYALNGLQAQPDDQVMLHVLRLWNRAHAGPMIPLVAVSGNPYLASLVPGVLNAVQSGDQVIVGSTVGVNVGAARLASTGARIALGVRPSLFALGAIGGRAAAAAPAKAAVPTWLFWAAVAASAVYLVKPQAVRAALRTVGIRAR